MRITRDKTSTPAAATLASLKERARVSDTDTDLALSVLMDAATEEIEAAADIALMRQTIIVELDADAAMPFALPIGPLARNAAVTLDGLPLIDAAVPGLRPVLYVPDWQPGPHVVTYDAGWDSTEALPADLRLAVVDQAAFLFDARGLTEHRQGLTPAAARAVARYKRVRL